LETRSFKELKGVVEDRINYYNQKRRHQSLGYLNPTGISEKMAARFRKTRKKSLFTGTVNGSRLLMII